MKQKLFRWPFLAAVFFHLLSCTDEDGFSIMFWNVENFFHPTLDQNADDPTFTPNSWLGYSAKAYALKCENLAGVVNSISPDILGLAEIENRQVLEDLVSCLDHSHDWDIVHRDSPDPRGIDCALIYRRSRLELLDSRFIPVNLPGGRKSRDILEAHMRSGSGELAVFTVHFPSRYGNSETSSLRESAAETLVQRLDEMLSLKKFPVIIMGDFNDTLEDISLQLIISYIRSIEGMRLITRDTADDRQSYWYNGIWMSYDHVLFILPSASAPSPEPLFQTVALPRLLKLSSGELIPFRNVSERRLQGGFSDHLPVKLTIDLGTKE